jgi:ribonuclease HII
MSWEGLRVYDLAQGRGLDVIIGVDEAGRGALAGPVCAAAVVVPLDLWLRTEWNTVAQSINDSKQMTPIQREQVVDLFTKMAENGEIAVAVDWGTVAEIEELNILGATCLAMERAIRRVQASTLCTIPSEKTEIWVDGRSLNYLPFKRREIVKGDTLSAVIALGSVFAKVARDAAMDHLALQYPGYGFEQHKGYGTAQHRAQLSALGPTEIHRTLFLRKILPIETEEPQLSFEFEGV